MLHKNNLFREVGKVAWLRYRIIASPVNKNSVATTMALRLSLKKWKHMPSNPNIKGNPYIDIAGFIIGQVQQAYFACGARILSRKGMPVIQFPCRLSAGSRPDIVLPSAKIPQEITDKHKPDLIIEKEMNIIAKSRTIGI